MVSPRSDSTDHPTLAQFAEVYLVWSKRRHTASTHETRRRLIEGIVVPGLDDVPLEAIDHRRIEALLESREQWSPATRNRVLTAVSSLLQRAMAAGVIRQNPAQGIERYREPLAPIPLVDLDAQDTLIESLPADMRPLFTTALETGARLGEMLRLRWNEVDLPNRTLAIARTKSGRPRLLRMTQRLFDTLTQMRPLPATPTGDRIFEEAVGGDGKIRWTWRQAFKEAARRIGFPKLRIHDLRHLHAVALVRAGVDLPTVQAQLGHRHLLSTLRYAAYADETASARAARALDDLRSDEGADP